MPNTRAVIHEFPVFSTPVLEKLIAHLAIRSHSVPGVEVLSIEHRIKTIRQTNRR